VEKMNRLQRMTKLVEALTLLLGEAHTSFMSAALAEGLTVRQMDYLAEVSRLGDPTMGDLTKSMGLSGPSTTAIIRRLVELGYVERTRSEEDGRSYRVQLTEKGMELERLHQQSHAELAGVLTRNLDDAEVDRLAGLFEKIVEG
jgi:DNA-binding MarR family transcriptional regulator